MLNVVWLPELPPSYGAGVGVLVGDREVVGPHAELLGGEDRQGHHGAGAVLLGAGHDPSAAVGFDPDEGARRAGRAEPPAGRDADRLVRPERPVGVDPLDRGLQRLDRAVALVALAGRALVAVVDEVAPPELDRVEPDAGGDRRRDAARPPSRPADPVGARTEPDGVRFV